jgi:hypothetical protein
MELAAMDGQAVPPGLERGVESLSEILTTAEHGARLPTPETVPAAELLHGLPGARQPAEGLQVQVCQERFRAVLRLVAADQVELQADERSDRASLMVGGQEAEGGSPAGRPVLSELARYEQTRCEREFWAPPCCDLWLGPAVEACGRTGTPP